MKGTPIFLFFLVSISTCRAVEYTVYGDAACSTQNSATYSCPVYPPPSDECIQISGTDFYYKKGCSGNAFCLETFYDYEVYADKSGNPVSADVTIACISGGVMNVSRCESGCSVELITAECIEYGGYSVKQSSCQNVPGSTSPASTSPTSSTPSKISSSAVTIRHCVFAFLAVLSNL